MNEKSGLSHKLIIFVWNFHAPDQLDFNFVNGLLLVVLSM